MSAEQQYFEVSTVDKENGEWIIRGIKENDPECIKSADALIDFVNEVGFLPLFKNDIPGFSVEERTVSRYWWSDNKERDPWLWREEIAHSGKVAYGKFFDKKAGFVSLEWFPHFSNYRRDGYDFDALWDDGKAKHRSKIIMDLFVNGEELFSNQAKRLAGFGKDGEKNFEGIVTELQMQTYLVIRDFRCRINKAGFPYGWPVTVYTAPESIWGYDFVASAYSFDPAESKEKMINHILKYFPNATEKQVKNILG